MIFLAYVFHILMSRLACVCNLSSIKFLTIAHPAANLQSANLRYGSDLLAKYLGGPVDRLEVWGRLRGAKEDNTTPGLHHMPPSHRVRTYLLELHLDCDSMSIIEMP
jgi:hypothetical protein